jgi:two-component system sensor kinase FixL
MLVSSAAILSDNGLSPVAERKPPATRIVLMGAALVMVLTLIGSSYIYLEGTRALRKMTEEKGGPAGATHPAQTDQVVAFLVKNMDAWVKDLSMATSIGGAGFVVVVAIGCLWWRHLCMRRIQRRLFEFEELNKRVKELTTDVQRQTAERRRAEQEVRQLTEDVEKRVSERTAQLSGSHEKMLKELNDRRQAERTMAQQAKELERSKDVLEMHVQVRGQEVQKLKSRYESILNSAGEGIYGLDAQGRTTFVNPTAAKITGWKVEELIGKLESEVFQLPSGAGPTKDANGDHGPDQVFFRKDGSSFPVEYMRTPIKEKDKDVGAVVIFKDITERKRAEENLNRKAAELARSNAELEQFAYVASHDLQEPLRKIQAFGDRLKTKCDAVNLQEGRDYLERMQSAAARMQALINDLLTFSRVISSQQPFVEVGLSTVIKGVLSDLEVRIEQTKAVLKVGELPTIEADPLQMRQLFQNLISNAMKFQPSGQQPVLEITAELIKGQFAGTPEEDPYAEQCQITVHDNGIGFEEKYHEKIFAVFQRLHGRNEYEGTGVGLAVCRRITDRHGGSITARSQPGQGASFVITLPVRHPKKELAP